MKNDPGDRPVLAVAVRSHSELIVTYNRRHFPAASVEAWEINGQGLSAFLRGLYDLDAGLFVGKLHGQAAGIGVSIQRLLFSLSKNVPGCHSRSNRGAGRAPKDKREREAPLRGQGPGTS